MDRESIGASTGVGVCAFAACFEEGKTFSCHCIGVGLLKADQVGFVIGRWILGLEIDRSVFR